MGVSSDAAASRTDGGPAFPVPETGSHATEPGMSLRDWFAGMALQGIKSNPELLHICCEAAAELGITQQQAIAQMAYQDADAMLAERESAE